MKQKFQLKIEYVLLILLFVAVVFTRIYFSLKLQYFSTDEAYFHLKHIEYFLQNHQFMNYDSLSYGGREIIYPPFFHLFMAITTFGSSILLKIIPELLISTTTVLIFFITKDITNNSWAALFAASISSFTPLFLSNTINTISIYSIVIPLLLLMLYALFHLDNKFFLWAFIISTFLLPFTHPSAFLFLLAIVFYVFLLTGEGMQLTKLKKEAFLFSITSIVLIEFIIYKKAFLEYGVRIFEQNIPYVLLTETFTKFTTLDLIISIGFLPIIFGFWGLYAGIINEKQKKLYLYSAFVLSIFFLLASKLITLKIGLMFLGIALSITSSIGIKKFFNALDKSKFSNLKSVVFIGIVILIVFTAIIPGIKTANEIKQIDTTLVNKADWIKEQVREDKAVLGNIDEGNLINYFYKRKNVIDSYFLMAPKPVERINDLQDVYTTTSQVKALEIIEKYNIDVIYLSNKSRELYNTKELKFSREDFCFDQKKGGYFYEEESC